MVNTINITDLMREAGINHEGVVAVTEDMSGLEQNPKNDWLYFGIRALQEVANGNERNIAFIGSGNGIDAIAALKQYKDLQKVYVTDIVPNILKQIEDNIRANVPQTKAQLVFKHGRDCESLDEKVDIIYLNLPLVAIGAQEINAPLATTTLTDVAAYAHLARGKEDLLRRYSMLSQLGALVSAKEKLTDNGIIVTMIGGRIPYEVTQECFQRAGIEHKLVIAGFKIQSDPQFLEQYAALEEKEKVDFAFFDYEKAAAIIKEKTGFDAPGEIKRYNDKQLKEILAPARLNAKRAFDYYRQGKDVGHLAYGFAACRPKNKI